MRIKSRRSFLAPKFGANPLFLLLIILALLLTACGDFTPTPVVNNRVQPAATATPPARAPPTVAPTFDTSPTVAPTGVVSSTSVSLTSPVTASSIPATPTTSPLSSPAGTSGATSGTTSGTTTLTPEQAAQEIKSKGSRVDPVLLPAKVPVGYVVTNLENGPDGFAIEYTDPGAAKKVKLSVVMPNLPPPGANGSQASPQFRGVKAFYQVDDATQSAGQRWLMWTEPQTANGSGQSNPGEPYLLSATGLTETEFWDFANSLTKVPTFLVPPPALNLVQDENKAIGNLKQFYAALNSMDFDTAYGLVVRPNRGPADRNDFILEHKALSYLIWLVDLQKQAAPPPAGSLVFQVNLYMRSSQPEGGFLPGNNTRFVEMVKDGGVWRVAGISSSPITPDSPVPTATPIPKLPSPAPDTSVYVQALDLSFINDNQGWALINSCKGPDCQANLKMTTDGGRSWQSKAAPPVLIYNSGQGHNVVSRVHFANSNDGWLFGPGLYSTHDGGASWQAEKFSEDIIEVSSAGNKTLAVTRACAQPGNLAACNLGLLSSTDNGHSWQKLSGFTALPGSAARLLTLTANDFWFLSYSPDNSPIEPGKEAIPTFVVTHDGGKSWQKLTNPANDKVCTNAGLAAASPKELWLACGTQPGAGQQLKYLYRSGDGGQSWTTLNSKALGGGGYLNSLAVSAPGKLWIDLTRGTLITSNDGGQTWNPAIPYEQANPGDGGIGPVVFADANHGWLAAAQGRIFRTVDGGATWQPVSLS